MGHTTVAEIDSHWTELHFAGWARAYFPNGVEAKNGRFLNQTIATSPVIVATSAPTPASVPVPAATTTANAAVAVVGAASGMNTPTEAAEKAKSYYENQTPTTPNECDHYCAFWYGLSASGFASATANWEATPDWDRLSGYVLLRGLHYLRSCYMYVCNAGRT